MNNNPAVTNEVAKQDTNPDIEHQDKKQEEDVLGETKGGLIAKTFLRLLPVFDEEDIKNLKLHKYSGSDEGLMYRFFYNPVANWLVSFLPDYIAPNLLTVIGFIHSITPVIVAFTVAGADLVGKVPNWILFLQAYCYFAYRLLDEMDGKQARNTGNSSPLGLLFDHGCDCFSTGLQLMLGLRTAQVGNNAISLSLMLIGMWSFHFTTLEEYYIGTLKLPVCNAVSDGSVIIVAFYIFSGIVGNEYWLKEVVSAKWLGVEEVEMLTLGQVSLMVFILLITLTIVANFIRIFVSRWYPRDTQSEKVRFDFLAVQVLAMVVLSAVWIWYAYCGDDPIMARPMKQVD